MTIVKTYDDDLSCLYDASTTFGVFDGVHKGHKFIIDAALDSGKNQDIKTCLITFDIDPDEIFSKNGFRKIMSNDDRIDYLSNMGFDYVIVLPFNSEIYRMDPKDFLNAIFSKNTPRNLFVGKDFRFGRNASGNVDDLDIWAKEHNMEVQAKDLLKANDETITSTTIRNYLKAGHIEKANELLGHDYFISGIVEHGRGDGAEFGVKTANISINENLDLLGEGVYGGYAVVDGKKYKAAISSGISPTFKDSTTANMEIHLIGYDGDLYNKRLLVFPLKRLRDMIKFDNVDDLISTIKNDISWIQNNICI